MRFQEVVKKAFVIVGYSSVGKIGWRVGLSDTKAQSFIGKEGVEKIVGICLSPRSNQYFYTCGIEIDSVNFQKVKEDMPSYVSKKQICGVYS